VKMSRKDMLLATIKGESTRSIPWCPRLDNWYQANSLAGTLPAEYSNASLIEIVDDLGWAYHAIMPTPKDLRSDDDDMHKALGIYNLWFMPVRTVLHDVAATVERWAGETRVEYTTPFGKLRTRMTYTEEMRRAGITTAHISERAVKSPDDYQSLGHIFENAEVVPNFGGYKELADRIGDRGLVVPYLVLAGSPMQLLQHVLMPFDLFFYEMADHPDEVARCAEAIGLYYERIFKVAVDAPSEGALLGENYDSSVLSPAFFRQHIAPWLRRFARQLHAKGKLLFSHPDGENAGLLDAYLESEFDVADSICPAPMTKLSLVQVRDHFAGRITIVGGIPSICLLSESMSDYEFNAHVDKVFSELGSGDHLILGIADTTPPGAVFDRLKKIAKLAEAFGPVNPGQRNLTLGTKRRQLEG